MKQYLIYNEPHPINGGVQRIYRFPNGYGASIVEHAFSYGTELAVVKFHGDGAHDFHLCYDTGITDDVLGHLTETEVQHTLNQIKELQHEVV